MDGGVGCGGEVWVGEGEVGGVVGKTRLPSGFLPNKFFK